MVKSTKEETGALTFSQNLKCFKDTLNKYSVAAPD